MASLALKTLRRTVQQPAIRGFTQQRNMATYEGLLKLTGEHESSADTNARLIEQKAVFDQTDKEYSKFAKDPEEIDWAFYEKHVPAHLVKSVKLEYEKTLAEIVAAGDPAKAEAEFEAKEAPEYEALASKWKVGVEKLQVEVTKLEEQLAYEEANKTHKYTTVGVMWKKFPKIKEESYQEIEDFKLLKDIK